MVDIFRVRVRQVVMKVNQFQVFPFVGANIDSRRLQGRNADPLADDGQVVIHATIPGLGQIRVDGVLDQVPLLQGPLRAMPEFQSKAGKVILDGAL